MDNESISAAATHVQERFNALRDEFPNLPTRIKTREDINDAKTAFNKIDEEFPDLRDKYLDNILPEAYATVKTELVAFVELRSKWSIICCSGI